MKNVQVTEKEAEILDYIATCDFSYDGNGLCGYILDFEFDLKVYRGVLSSLVKKDIITAEGINFYKQGRLIWVTIKPDFQKKSEEAECGYELTNIERP